MDHGKEKQARGSRPASQRALKRERRLTAAIVGEAVRDLRPGAPLLEVMRLATARCAAVGLPAPSRNALVAKVAEANERETRPRMIVLDNCLIETRIGGSGWELATLHVAVLHPPGRLLAHRLIAGPADPAIDAELLIDVQSASGPIPDTRVRLAGTGPVERDIRAALADARMTAVARITRENGVEEQRVLGRSLLPDRIRLRAPRAAAGVSWAAPHTIALLRRRLEEAFAFGPAAGTRALPIFGLAPPHLASTFVADLREIVGRRSRSADRTIT